MLYCHQINLKKHYAILKFIKFLKGATHLCTAEIKLDSHH